MEKNRDTFSSDLMQLVQTSNNKFLTSLFFTDMQIVSSLFFFHLFLIYFKIIKKQKQRALKHVNEHQH